VILCGGNSVFEPWIHGALIVRAFYKDVTFPLRRELPLNTYRTIRDTHTADFWTRDTKEADYMADILRDSDAEIVFVENKSKHTGANFENIRDFVIAEGFNTASIVTTAYHQLRAQETCKRWIPELKTTPVPVYPYGLSRNTWLREWPKTLIIKGVVSGEYEKLNPDNPNNYYRQGHCVPL